MTPGQLGDLIVGGLVARQLFVLGGVLRSIRFLRNDASAAHGEPASERSPEFYIVLPVLREATSLPEAVAHFQALSAGHRSAVVVVTTAREAAEAVLHPGAADTVAVAEGLAREGGCYHLHYPDPQGLKADQINLAVEFCAATIVQDASADRAFVVIYDVDSRPPRNSLTRFAEAIARYPSVGVFHQSSSFELRVSRGRSARSLVGNVRRAIADSGALRANRFVLAYEIPRLLNRANPTANWVRRLLASVYAHVTGHGLCIRLSLLKALPFPPKSPLEDMHYSFILGSRDYAMLPIASLDHAEVPESPSRQFQQMTRWVFGPARFLRYLNDPATQPGWRSRLRAASAAAITIEWLACAVLPLLLAVAFVLGEAATRVLIAALVAIYGAQLVLADRYMGRAGSTGEFVMRLALYPVTLILFGVAGLVGVGVLLRGGSGAGKTERGVA